MDGTYCSHLAPRWQEEVRDLLVPERAGAPRAHIRIQELPSGVCLAGAVEREVASQEEMEAILQVRWLCCFYRIAWVLFRTPCQVHVVINRLLFHCMLPWQEGND